MMIKKRVIVILKLILRNHFSYKISEMYYTRTKALPETYTGGGGGGIAYSNIILIPLPSECPLELTMYYGFMRLFFQKEWDFCTRKSYTTLIPIERYGGEIQPDILNIITSIHRQIVVTHIQFWYHNLYQTLIIMSAWNYGFV